MNKHTDPRTIPLGEWTTLDLQEGREGEEVEVEWSPGYCPPSGLLRYAWLRTRWVRDGGFELPGATCDDILLRWRWLKRVDEGGSMVEFVEAAEPNPNIEHLLPDVLPYRDLERIVGEVQQALAGKPADQCVTDEGRAVAGLWDGLDYYLGRDDDGVAIDTFTALEALCAEKGWKP